MNNKSFATLGLLALLGAASAFGQKQADIPFEFHFGKAVMPAGHYSVTMPGHSTPHVLTLSCFACRVGAAATVLGAGGGIRDARPEGRLVFHKYGDKYFLASVWSPNSEVGSALRKSKSEREIARNTPQAEADQVVLAQR